MPKVTKVLSARKDVPHADIKVGDTYYWWKFRFGGKRYSKTYPKASELTQSNYLSQLYDIQDEINGMFAESVEDIEYFIEDIKERLESLKDETEESLNNMPESLQYSPTGELLQERIDSLDLAISEFESIDLDFDEESDESLEDWISDKISEIQDVGFE